MKDFFVAGVITAGGALVFGKIDQSRATGMQKQSCIGKGGTYNDQDLTCHVGGQAVSTQYSLMGPMVTLGIPVVAALLYTRSLPGAIGAAVGAAGIFLVAISGIH